MTEHQTTPEADLTRRAVLANLRHELRTPLNAIIGYSEMLIEDIQDAGQEDFLSDLSKIHSAGRQLLSIVNDILDSKKIESGQMNPDPEAIGDRLRLELITPLNAIIGFSEMLIEETQDQEKLLSDIRKIDTAAKHFLTLLNDIVNFQKIRSGIVMSETQDNGDCSMIREVVKTIHTQKNRADIKCGCILIVDDNEMNRFLLSRYLRREGYSVEMAENGVQALEIIRAKKFDLMISDIMMPEMNGFELLQHIRTDPELRDIPVIMISALDEMASVVRCIEAGAEDYLPKPFNPVLLRARINACLEKKRLRDQEILYLQQIEAEKKRADDLLRVILPDEIVSELKLSNIVKPKYYPDVAVLFTDVVGFTPYCDKHSPEDVLLNLQSMIESFEGIALKYDLQKIKTIGDAFMAVAGLLKPLENPVENCVKAGLEMIHATHSLPAKWQVRIGIHFGMVMGGIVGHRQYLFDVWGDTVNTAQRIESNGKPDAVCLSNEAWLRLCDQFEAESQGFVQLKGKGRMEIFRII